MALAAAGIGALVLLSGLSAQETWARWGDTQRLTRDEQLATGQLDLTVAQTRATTIYGVQDTPVSATRSIPDATCQAYPNLVPVSSIPALSSLAPAGTQVADECQLTDGATGLTVSAGDLVVIKHEVKLTAVGKNLTGDIVVASQAQLPEPYEFLGVHAAAADGSGQQGTPDSDGEVRVPFRAAADPQTLQLRIVVRIGGHAEITDDAPSTTSVQWNPEFTVHAEQGDR